MATEPDLPSVVSIRTYSRGSSTEPSGSAAWASHPDPSGDPAGTSSTSSKMGTLDTMTVSPSKIVASTCPMSVSFLRPRLCSHLEVVLDERCSAFQARLQPSQCP